MKTHLSLFSGIGGLDLAAEWAGFTTVGQCEWADYPTKVLEKHWPDAPKWKDIKTLTGESFYERTGLHTVDVISGGFPCQPFSVAGKQRGKEDDRYLWPEMVRVIKELRPTWVIGENVAGIVKMALPDILSEMEACGYRTRTFLVPACAVGARHRRYRVAIVAWDTDGRKQHKGTEQSVEKRQNSESTGICSGTPGTSKNVAYTKGKGERGLPVQQGRPQQEDNDTKRTGKTLANTESQHERRLLIGKGQEKPGFISSSKDVQYSDSAGREEQYSSEKPDNPGFSCRRRDAGDVCNATGKGLSDRTGQQMERQRAPKSEFKRPDRHVSERRKWENDSAQQRAAQSRLGGMVDGIPDWVDRNFIINHYWDTEPDIHRVAIGVPDRVGRLKALGNAVVPQQFYPFFKTIADVMEISRKEESVWKD